MKKVILPVLVVLASFILVVGCRKQLTTITSPAIPIATMTPTPPKRVFVTSQNYSGNLGGLSGADSKCSSLASAAGLGIKWKAWLSDSNTDAKDRIVGLGPWYFVDGKTLVFSSKGELPLVPLNHDELGNLRSDVMVRTGTAQNGTKKEWVFDPTYCNDWTTDSTLAVAIIGNTSETGVRWTNWGGTACNYLRPIYCFEL